MKKKISILFLIALMIVAVTIPANADTTSESEICRLKKMNADAIITEMIALAEDNDVWALIDQAGILATKTEELDETYVASLILNRDIPESVRVTLLQLTESIPTKENEYWERKYEAIAKDETENSELRKNAVWLMKKCESTENILEDLVMQNEGELAFQALKRLNIDAQEKALILAESILSEYKTADADKLRQAIKVVSTLEKNAKKSRMITANQFSKICDSILTESDDQLLNDTILFALKDIGDETSETILLNNKKVDNLFKHSYFDDVDEKGVLSVASTKLGCAVYRDGAGINIDWHTGIMVEANSSSTPKCIAHITDVNNGVIIDTLGNFKSNQEFKGVYRPKNGFTNAKRTAVANTARRLATESINYTVLQQVKYSSMDVNNTTKASPSLITHIRCDGVTEYCYEYNDIRIYGNDVNWDISINRPANVNAHSGYSISPKIQAEDYMTLINREEP